MPIMILVEWWYMLDEESFSHYLYYAYFVATTGTVTTYGGHYNVCGLPRIRSRSKTRYLR